MLRIGDEQYSSQAVHSARKKLPPGAFKEVNRFLHRGPHKPRFFAVDGSKVHIHPSLINAGYKTRTNDKPALRPAKRPLVMLSSMVDVKTKACVDFELTKHFNERKAAASMLRSVRQLTRYWSTGGTIPKVCYKAFTPLKRLGFGDSR